MLFDLTSPAAFTPPPNPILVVGPTGSRDLATSTGDFPQPPVRGRSRQFPPSTGDATGATALGAETVDPVSEYIVKEAVRLWKQQLARAQIEDRVRELRIEALRTNEKFSEKSLVDLRAFLDALPLVERPSIFLLDSGNLRALWKNAKNEQIGLQFLGDCVGQFVLFVQREKPTLMSRVAGIDTLSEIRSRIKANAYERLFLG